MKITWTLQELVRNGSIIKFDLQTINEDGIPVTDKKGNRNTERLTLYFPNGSILEIDTFCSGSAENTCLWFTLSKEGSLSESFNKRNIEY